MTSILKSTNTELDFETIKESLKSFLKNQSKFTDYNFEGSGLSILLDILSYNTHFNALNAHLALNEMHLSSAVVRENVVNHAKSLGYIPFSKTSSTAIVKIEITPPMFNVIQSYTLSKGTRLVSAVDRQQFSFYVFDDYVATKNAGKFTFNNVIIKEGVYKTIRFIYDSKLPFSRFEIPDKDVDISTIGVKIKNNTNSTIYTSFEMMKSYSNIDSSTNVFYLQENSNGKYEVYFGNGVIGTEPENGNIIEIDYIYTTGKKANGAKSFIIAQTLIESGEICSVTTTTRASGGAEKETIESIRRNAPLFYSSQNRCVTLDDYKTIVLNNYPGIETISVWGGENEIIPEFGKIFLSIKPVGAEALTEAEKLFIINNILEPKKVATVTPEIIDPEYTTIILYILFKYNAYKTSLSYGELVSNVRSVLQEYDTNDLRKFNGAFRHSNLLSMIDNSDLAIINSSLQLFFEKSFTPSAIRPNVITLRFPAPILIIDDDIPSIISTAFKLNGIDHYFTDKKIVGDPSKRRRVSIIKYSGNSATTESVSVGYVYPLTGIIELYGFQPDNATPITIRCRPNSSDISPSRNQLLTLDYAICNITGERDTISERGIFINSNEQSLI